MIQAIRSPEPSSGAAIRVEPRHAESGRESSAPIRVALIHNYYQQSGGEDEVVRAETELLTSRGHDVIRYTRDNHDVPAMGRLSLASTTLWSSSSYRDMRALFRRERPEVALFHNTHPLVSPSAYYAARAEGVPVVQTLHNFRLVCPNGLLFRDGHVCEDCLGKAVPWPGVVHACYRQSRSATAVTAGMLGIHRAAGTWDRAVNMYIALSEFAAGKFVAGGLPADKLVVKPNFLSQDPGTGSHTAGFGLFVGRLSPEKGLDVLQRASERLGGRVPIKVIGGPLPAERPEGTGIEWTGPQPRDVVFAEMGRAGFLIFPSVCYENCPMTIIEAFARGLPVVVSGQGSAAAMVKDGVTGRHFRPGDSDDLAHQIDQLLSQPDTMAAMGRSAREAFDRVYSADSNYTQLMDVYRRARGA